MALALLAYPIMGRVSSVSMILSLSILSCSSTIPGRYVIFGEEGFAITLRADGTFTCSASADLGGTHFRAEGEWRRISKNMIETQITRVLIQSPRQPELFGEVGKVDWIVTNGYLTPARWTLKKVP